MAINTSSMNFDQCRELFRQFREDNDRRSELIVDLWKSLMSRHIRKLGDEKWLVYEQVATAALDLHDWEIVKHCISQLNKEFPDSLRVAKLKAMHHEAMQRYESALELYDSILEADESNAVVYKRKIALIRATQSNADAIKELNEYLKKFMSDSEAWLELCDLYLCEQEYSRASFCVEELIISNPHNHLYYQRYAEIQYSIGTMESVELARAYFANAFKLNEKNNRALYGMLLSANFLATSSKCPSNKRKENQKISQWASDRLGRRYKEATKLPVEVEKAAAEVLSQLTISSSTSTS